MKAKSTDLAERVHVLRDEVLDTAEREDPNPPGAEVFDAIVRAVVAQDETSPGIDLTLHDAVSRRLAWGEPEEVILGDADRVCHRLLGAGRRAFRDPVEEMLVAELATEVVCTVARTVALAAVGRAGRERAARMREELSQRRLRDALQKQREERTRLEQEIAAATPSAS